MRLSATLMRIVPLSVCRDNDGLVEDVNSDEVRSIDAADSTSPHEGPNAIGLTQEEEEYEDDYEEVEEGNSGNSRISSVVGACWGIRHVLLPHYRADHRPDCYCHALFMGGLDSSVMGRDL